MTRIVAIDHEAGKALFRDKDLAIVVDTSKRDVDSVGEVETALTAAAWMKVAADVEYPKVWKELAEAAMTGLEVEEKKVEPPVERKFRIPLSVKREAQQGLDWAKGFERGGTNVGFAMAKLLSEENYLTFSKLQRIARYFSRRPASITENAGWSPGEQGFPTDERIKYSLWGGQSAREWVTKIDKKHPLIAAAPVPPVPSAEPVPAEGGLEADPNKPHEYVEDPELPGQCLVCGRELAHPLHVVAPVDQEQPIIATAFEHDPECDYFGKGINPDSTEVEDLYMRRPDGTWQHRVANQWEDMEEPAEDEIIIMLDPESAAKLAEVLDDLAPEDPSVLPFELAMLNPAEAAMFNAAYAEIDWELVDRVFDIYDSQERSINAGRQVRGPGGRFGDMPDDPDARKVAVDEQTKARLPQALPVLPDVGARIDQYLADVAKKRGGGAPAPAEGESPAPVDPTTSANIQNLAPEFREKLLETYKDTVLAQQELAEGDPGTVTDVRPLYLAIVDEVDTEAVLDLVSLVPPVAGQAGDVVAWKRDNGTWAQADDILAELRGTTPPPVVELTDDALLNGVIEQVDAATTEDEPQEEAPGAPAKTTEEAPKPDANPDQHPAVTAAVAEMFSILRSTDDTEMQLRICKRLLEYGYDRTEIEFGDKTKKERDKLSKKSMALPDGSFPIESVNDLKNAVKAFGRAKNKELAKQHITKRARALNRLDLLPADWDKSTKEAGYMMWGPHGEIISLAEGGMDRNRGNAEELRRYWVKGEGAVKIGWNTPGDWYRCVSHLSKYLGTRAKGYCTLRHKEATGMWPGERENH